MHKWIFLGTCGAFQCNNFLASTTIGRSFKAFLLTYRLTHIYRYNRHLLVDTRKKLFTKSLTAIEASRVPTMR